jgi:hypothetical protein
LINMENKLAYLGTASGNQYLNIAKDLSWLNSKNEEVTSRDGHVYGYLVDIQIHSKVTASFSAGGAPNTWKMRNAFRKWHAYRDGMFKDAGVSKSEMGRYGRTIRPYLDKDMAGGTILVPAQDAGRGTWTYTTMASTPGWSAAGTGTEGEAIVDTYALNVLDANQVQSTSAQGVELYSAAGMIHSYNLDRMEVVTPTDGETIEGPNNPLAMIRFTGAAGGQVMEIAEDQEEEATPYDINDDGDSVELCIKAIAQLSVATANVWDSSSNTQVTNIAVVPKLITLRNVFIPAGLLKLYSSASDGTASVLVTVHGKWLCKDYA